MAKKSSNERKSNDNNLWLERKGLHKVYRYLRFPPGGFVGPMAGGDGEKGKGGISFLVVGVFFFFFLF